MGFILADPVQLHQVVMNLATNAVQAFEKEQGKISIELNQHELPHADLSTSSLPSGTYACLKVKDNAGGIPQDIIGRIFDPYFTTKSPEKGTGLGLATVYGIVKELCGAVFVHSQVGQGTQFTVHLPVMDPVCSKKQPQS